MRHFYVLAGDGGRDDDLSVSDYELGGFDARVLWRGSRLEEPLPSGTRLWASGNPTDYVGNPLSWTITSERLGGILQSIGGESIQVLKAPLLHQTSKTCIPGYVIVNVVRVISALPPNCKPNLQNLALIHSRIPESTHIFRLKESSTTLIISGHLLSAMSGKQFKGVVTIDTHPAG